MAERKLQDVISIIRNRVLSIPQVTGVGYDEEEKQIVVTVQSEEVADKVREKVPSNLAGYPVTVKIQPPASFLWNRKAKHRPVSGGISACVETGTACTNATRVYDKNGNIKLLSNVHCYSNIMFTGEYGEKGTAIDQPGPKDQVFGGRNYKCGEQWEWIPYKNKKPNFIDAALAKPTVEVSDFVLGEDEEKWKITESTSPKKGLSVKKAGRTSGVTKGKIIHAHQDVKVGGGTQGTLIFSDQVVFQNTNPNVPVVSPGDSGSILITEKDEKAVGLVFAGSTEPPYVGIASSIGYVMSLLDIGFQYPLSEPPEFPEEEAPSPERDVVLLAGLPLLGVSVSRLGG